MPAPNAEAVIRNAEDSFPNDPAKRIDESRKYLQKCAEAAVSEAHEKELPEEIEAGSNDEIQWYHSHMISLLDQDPDWVALTVYVDRLASEISEATKAVVAAEQAADAEKKRGEEVAALTETRALYEQCGVDTAKIDEAIEALSA